MLLLHARWLVPVSEPPIEYGTVAVDGRHIAYVGPRAGAPRRGTEHDLGEALLMPGLVNAHCLLEETVLRGSGPGLETAGAATPGRLARARSAALTDEALLDSARLGVAEGLRAGVTTYADSAVSGASLRALTEAGARGIVHQEVTGAAPGERARSLDALRAAIERLRPLETELVRLGVAPHAPYAVHEDLLIDACAYALSERLPISIRVAESRAEIGFLREGTGTFADALRARGIVVERRSHSPVHLLKELGVSDVARPLLVHCVELDASDVAFVAGSGCPVAHCPSSNARRGHGIAPLVELLDAGVAVGLGSDSVAAGGRMDILEEARTATMLQALRTGRAYALGTARALELATLGGARALGLDDRVGSLEVGKEADLAAFPLQPTRAVPAHDPVATAVLSVAGTPASFVAVAGAVRVSGGRLQADDPGLASRVQHAADALRAWERLDAGASASTTARL